MAVENPDSNLGDVRVEDDFSSDGINQPDRPPRGRDPGTSARLAGHLAQPESYLGAPAETPVLAEQLNEILASFQAKLVEVMEQQIKAMTASTFTPARPTAAEQPDPSQAKASKPPRRFSKKDSPKRNEERAQPLDAARRLNWSRALNTARWQPRRELSATQETGIPFSDAREYLQGKKAARKAESVEDEYSDTGSTPVIMDPPLTYNSQRHSSLREMAGQTSRTHPDRAVEQNKPSRHTVHETQAPLAKYKRKWQQ